MDIASAIRNCRCRSATGPQVKVFRATHTRGSRAHLVSIWPERDVPILPATGDRLNRPVSTVPLGPMPALSGSREA